MFPSKRELERQAKERALAVLNDEKRIGDIWARFFQAVAPILKTYFRAIAAEHIKLPYKVVERSEVITESPFDSGHISIGNASIVEVAIPSLGKGWSGVYLEGRFASIVREYRYSQGTPFTLSSRLTNSTLYSCDILDPQLQPDSVIESIKSAVRKGFEEGSLGTVYREKIWFFKYVYYMNTVHGTDQLRAD